MQYTNVYYICIVKFFQTIFQSEELKARIEHVKRNLLFYSLYRDLFVKKGMPVEELERRIDDLLDKLIELLKELTD